MSEGCLIFANKTDEFDYLRFAEEASKRVQKHLNIPTIILQDQDVSAANVRFFLRGEKPLKWNNLNRTKSYDLSPFDRTLVIDADFFINSDALLPHMKGSFDFGIVKDMINPMTGEPFKPMMGYSQIQQLWATVMIFNKCDLVEKIFSLAEMVLANYSYYAKLYSFPLLPLRNDYAFTIACHLLGGYGNSDFSLRYRMINCDTNTEILEINENSVLVGQKNSDKMQVMRLKNADVHLQHKKTLMECINATTMDI
jgi:hypothetical protein